MTDPVQRRLNAIEEDLLNGSPLADCLRKCIALGADLRSAPLREWAQRELTGYPAEVEPPAYRKVSGGLAADISAGGKIVKVSSINNLPASVRQQLSAMGGRCDVRAGIAEVEAMAAHADAHWAGSVHLPVSFAREVKSHLNEAASGGARIDDVYWNVNASVFRGLIDQVRTTAVSILTEIRVESAEAGMSGTEAASNAIHLHVEGGSRHSINVTTNRSVHGHAGTASAGDGEAVRWTKRQTYWTVLGVVIAIAALYMAYLQVKA